MCIIMSKPKGVALPDKATFRRCYQNNPDGCGYMYVEKGKVIIKKGFMGYKNMYKEIRNLLERQDRSVVVHFRIGTSGKKDQKTCHPYPITNEVKGLQKTYFETDLGIVHNGIISGYSDRTNTDLNDTQVFIRDFLSVLKDLNRDFYKQTNVLKMLEQVTTSKLTFLDNKDEIYYVGDFIQDESGVYYSNGTYKVESYWRAYESYSRKNKYESHYDNEYPVVKVADYEDDFFYEDYYDIDLDNYRVIQPGEIVSTVNDIIEVTEFDKFGIDGNGNFFELDDKLFPSKILNRAAGLYNSKYEEIIV